MKYSLYILVYVLIGSFCFSQSDESTREYDKISNIITSKFGLNYEVSYYPLDVDKEYDIVSNNLRDKLSHCIVTSYCRWDSTGGFGSGVRQNDSGAIAIIKDNKLLWYSKNLITNYNGHTAKIIGLSDINRDGIIEAILSIKDGPRYEYECLWFIQVDSSGGKLLNGVNGGESIIIGITDSFEFIKSLDDQVLEIRSQNIDTDIYEELTYLWNGNLIVKK